MIILVTGAAGYIGSTLVQYLLEAGDKVIGTDSLMYDNGHALLGCLGHKRFEFHKADVREASFMRRLERRADVIIPLAALVGAPRCDVWPTEAMDVNTTAIVDLVKRLSPTQKVLFPNTNSGYGETDGTSEVTEDDALLPISLYGRTKCVAEKAILDHENSAVFRLATVFGASPRMRTDLMLNDFVLRLRLGIPAVFEVFEPHFQRNFVHVRDVARAFLCALSTNLRGVFNLGHPEANISKIDLAHKICDTLGITSAHIKIGQGTDPDRRNYRVSNKKILERGFVFRHGMEEGIWEVAQLAEMFGWDQLSRMGNV